MASTFPGFRFVRCPKCKKVLAEYANVPVYKCGECGTSLRSKLYNATRENIVDASQEINSQNLPDSNTFDKGSPMENERTVCVSEDRAQNAASPSPQVSEMDASSSYHQKGDGSEHEREEHCTDERGTDNGRNGKPTLTDCSLNEDKSLKLCQQGHGSLKFCGRRHDSAESSDPESASSEDKENRNHHDRHGDASRPNSPNQNASDDSVSSATSATDGCNTDTPRKCIPMSRRTFKRRELQGPADADLQKGEGVKEMAVETKDQAQAVPQEPPKENPPTISTIDSNANECSQKGEGHVTQDVSLNFKDFKSVQNWMEPENLEPLVSPSKKAQVPQGSANNQNDSMSAELNSLGFIQMKIMQKVDELKEEINELFDKSDKAKGRSNLRVIQEKTKNFDSAFAQRPPKPSYQSKEIHRRSRLAEIPCKHCQHEGQESSVRLPAQSGFHSRICTACHCERSSNPSANVSPRNHMICRPLPSRHDSLMQHEPEKSYGNGRRQQRKRPCRPVLGGAPFVMCHNCLELLKLPMDFFFARKRLYKVQCGACSKVLTFSFRARNHGIPDTPNDEVETPTTELDSSSTDATPGHEIWNSHINDRSQLEPVSYSEDYGISYSTDVELPEHIPMNSSRMREKRNSKLRTGSELHMLMGYGSASELLYRHSDIDEVSEITEATTPHCNTPEEAFVGDIMTRRGSYVSDPSTSRYF
ncbi:hypothetical protein Cni_G23544 [Canna indica]|uniref:Zinc-ribbon domain-containing protein n=1 Tax=Canna indica TaxID=4628 RepID=A0AAQ3KTN1_9LILI|nr:hypothetical protein Cni_G23544 [Canna indica]